MRLCYACREEIKIWQRYSRTGTGLNLTLGLPGTETLHSRCLLAFAKGVEASKRGDNYSRAARSPSGHGLSDRTTPGSPARPSDEEKDG